MLKPAASPWAEGAGEQRIGLVHDKVLHLGQVQLVVRLRHLAWGGSPAYGPGGIWDGEVHPKAFGMHLKAGGWGGQKLGQGY